MRAFWYQGARTTVVFDAASASGYEAALNTYNWSHTTTTQANRTLLVFVAVFASGTVSSVTYNSVNLTFVNADSNGVYRIECWRLFAPATGANSVVVTLSGSLTSIASAQTYYNSDQSALDASTTNNGTNTPASKALMTVADLCTVVGGLAAQTASGVTSATTQNNRTANQGALGTHRSDDFGDVTPAGSKTFTWNNLGALDSWAISLVSLRPPQVVGDNLDWLRQNRAQLPLGYWPVIVPVP